MLRYLLLACVFMSGTAIAAQDCDIRSNPSSIEGSAPTHIDGNEDGRPIIHRPEIPRQNRVSNGVALMPAGESERTITYGGRGRGSFGSRSSPTIVTNEDGRPQLRYAD